MHYQREGLTWLKELRKGDFFFFFAKKMLTLLIRGGGRQIDGKENELKLNGSQLANMKKYIPYMSLP